MLTPYSQYTLSMPKVMRIILAVLLLAIPLAWLGLRALPEESPPPGPALAPSRSVSVPNSSSATPGSRASEVKEEVPKDGAEKEELRDEHELEGPGPCIELVVTVQGAPVGNAKVAALRREEDDNLIELTALPVGPEGRRKAWCQPGTYLLVASAPGFAPKNLQLTVGAGSTPVARFELDTGHTLIGRVLDKDSDQPIAAARLSLSFANGDFGLIVPEHSVTSDAKGLFRVDALAAGTYQLDAEAPGHTGMTTDVAVPRSESLSIELDGTSRLEGQVVTGAGAPVPGAEVWVLSDTGDLIGDAPERTDVQGRFSVEVEEGTYQLGASAGSEFGLHEGKVTVARGGLVDGLVIRLRPSGSLVGKVFVKSSHEPVENARLFLEHTGSSWSYSALSDASGGFRVDRLIPGTYTLTIFQSGFQMAQREGVPIQVGQETSVELALVRLASVQGLVTDAQGRPADDAFVIAEPAVSRRGVRDYQVFTDVTGHYEFEDLPSGSYRLEARVSSEGQPVVRELTLQEGEEAQADFVLPYVLGQVEGSVKRASGGLPIHPVEVEAAFGDSGTVTTEVDDTGHFTVRLLPGSYTLKAMYSDTEEAGPAVPVTVEADKVSRVSLTVPDALTETSGVVLNARGEPVAGASVNLEDGDDLFVSAITDARGRFSLRTPLKSAGRSVFIHADNEPEEGEAQNVRLGSQNVVVRLRKPGALRGRISAVRGPPVQGFDVEVARRKDGIIPSVQLDSRPFTGDSFEMVDLPTGTLDLRVQTPDGRIGTATVRVTPGQTAGVEISVDELGSGVPKAP
jgi:hypothetical protein